MGKKARTAGVLNQLIAACAGARGIVRLGLLGGGGVGLGGGGCVKEPPPFDPMTFQSSERDLARQLERPKMRPLPTTLETPYQPGRSAANWPTTAPTTGPNIPPENAIRLTLQEMIQRSVVNSHDVRV